MAYAFFGIEDFATQSAIKKNKTAVINSIGLSGALGADDSGVLIPITNMWVIIAPPMTATDKSPPLNLCPSNNKAPAITSRTPVKYLNCGSMKLSVSPNLEAKLFSKIVKMGTSPKNFIRPIMIMKSPKA